MEVLSPEEVKRVLDVCGARDRALVMTLIDSGLRRGEALALDWEDVDLHTGAVHLRRGKGGKARVTYVGAKTRRALQGMRLRGWRALHHVYVLLALRVRQGASKARLSQGD